MDLSGSVIVVSVNGRDDLIIPHLGKLSSVGGDMTLESSDSGTFDVTGAGDGLLRLGHREERVRGDRARVRSVYWRPDRTVPSLTS